MNLAPCPACRRHIADSECPFCDAALAATSRSTAPSTAPRGRLSRAMVMSAALVAGNAACGGAKPKPDEPPQMEERDYPDHPCVEPDPTRIAELEKKKEAAQTDEEKAQIDQELAQARQPMCAPYGAPPARRRVV